MKTQIREDNLLTRPSGQKRVKIKVCVINHYLLIQQSLRLLIENNQDMSVIGCYPDFNFLTKNPESEKPDVILIYLSEGTHEIFEEIPKLSENGFGESRIVVVANGKDIEGQLRAVELGAVGIVQKEQNSKMLIESIRQTFSGETWINQTLLSKLLNGNKKGKLSAENLSADEQSAQSLTAREQQVIGLIGEGLKNKEIARRLFISEATVRHHLSSIYGKLGVDDRLNLVIYAYQKGLL